MSAAEEVEAVTEALPGVEAEAVVAELAEGFIHSLLGESWHGSCSQPSRNAATTARDFVTATANGSGSPHYRHHKYDQDHL